MWNTTGDFGNAGGFAQTSGGFFNNTSTATTPGSQEKKKTDRLTNVIPCTIAQIHEIPENEENLKVGSITARIVTFVGMVRTVDSQSTKMTYIIDDMSGPSMEVQVWVGENAEIEKRMRCIQENTYVRVTGAVRSMKGKRHVIAFKLSPITDLNELTMHILEVIHTSMSIEQMDRQSTGMASNFSTTFDKSMNSTNTFASGASFANHGYTKPQQLVIQAISANSSPEGISVDELCNSIKSLSRHVIKDAIEFLSNEGHIYSTIDEDHYKSTESM